MHFSFIIPTRGRPDSLLRLCESIRLHTSRLEQLEIILVVDLDDEQSRSFSFPQLNIRKVELPPGKKMGELNMAGYRASTGDHVMLLNDDMVLRTPGWDETVLQVFESFPDGVVLVHINDKLFGPKLCTFPFLTRKFCNLLGEICPEGYVRYRIDDHIHNVFDLLTLLGHRRRIYLPDIVFEHFNVTDTEEGHEYVPNPEIHTIDTRLFDALLPERKRIALAALELIEEPARAGQRRVRESKLDIVTDSVSIRDPRHARWIPPEERPRVTVGVVSADIRSEHAKRCINLIKAHTTNYDLVIVDNNGGTGFNHSREMNRLLSFCRTDYLVLIDDDVFVEQGWLEGMMRAIQQPGAGVVTPVHKDASGKMSYAGVVLQPDGSGHHTHVMQIGSRPECIQTVCSAIMLIDMTRCGNVRLDESYSKYFLDVDYGLKIWEEGYSVLCTPEVQVTHIGGGTLVQGSHQSVNLFEQQRRYFVHRWVETGRLDAVRRLWRSVPELAGILALEARIEKALGRWRHMASSAVLDEAAALNVELEPWPALRNHLVSQANKALAGRVPRADDPETGRWAIVLGVLGTPVLYEAQVDGMNIVFCNRRFYALPANEGAFDYDRMRRGGYNRSFEASSVEAIRQMITEHKRRPANRHVSEDEEFGKAAAPPPFTSILLPAYVQRIGKGRWKMLIRLLNNVPHLPVLRTVATTLFDVDYYLRTNPDVAQSGMNPFWHFVVIGAYEGRNPNRLFDTSFYLRMYPDVAASGINPLAHYVKHGAAEGRQPHPLFDPDYYLSCNPDVKRQRINPLLHYMTHGAAEGRLPCEGYRWIA